MKYTRFYIALLSFIFCFSTAFASEFYWVNNGGNWSDFSNHWQDDQGTFYNRMPSDTDDVYFNAASFSANGQTVVIDVPVAHAQNIDFTGVTNAPALQGNPGDTIAINGSLRFETGLTNNFNGLLDFRGDNSDSLISKGVAIAGDLRYSGFGRLNQGDILTINGTLYLQSGTYKTNGEDLIIEALWSDNGNTRAFRGDTSIIRVNGSGEVWKINEFNFTLGVDSCFLVLDHNTNAEVQFNPGGNLINYNSITVAAPNTYITEEGNFGQFTIDPGVFLKLKASAIFDVINLFAQGTCDAQIIIQSDIAGTQAFINQPGGIVSGNYLKLKDINAGGGATFDANNSIDEGNVLGWNITEPTGPPELYWINGSGDWNDAAHWSATSGGASAGCIPGPNTNVFFDANSFTGPANAVFIDYNAYCSNMDWSAATQNPVLDGNADFSIQIHGNLEMIAAMTAPFDGLIEFKGTGTHTINTNALQLNAICETDAAGTWDLNSDFSSRQYLNIKEGNFNSNGNSLDLGAFYMTTTANRNVNLTGSLIDLNSDSLVWQVSSTNLVTDFSNTTVRLVHPQISPVFFDGGNLVYNNLILNTRLSEILGNNQFALISIPAGNTLTLGANETTTVDSLSATGTCSDRITIETLTALAPPATLLKTGFDSLQVDYCTINNVEADTAGGKFYNAQNSQLLYNTNGWTADSLLNGTTYYWVNGTGTWSDPNHWSLTSGGTPATCIPGILDTVIFDQNSGDPDTVEVNQDAFCAFMDWVNVGGNPNFKLYRNVYIREGAILSTNMEVNAANPVNAFSSKLTFISDSNNVVFNTEGIDINTFVYFDGAALTDTFFLQNDLLLDSTFAAFLMLNGTFQSNANAIKASRVILESQEDKLLHIENSYIQLSSGWNAQNAGNSLTVSAQGSLIEVLGLQAPSFFHGADAIYHNLILRQEVNDTLLLTGSNTYNRVVIDKGVLMAVEANSVHTANDSIIAIGTCRDSITMISTNPGSFYSWVQVNVAFRGECLNIQDAHTAGAGVFPVLFSTDLGGNGTIYWNFRADKTSNPGFTVPSFDVCPGDTVNFTNTSTAFDNNPTSLSYVWDFDDGDTSQQENPAHVYTSGGVFNITLESTYLENGCTETYTDSVRVNQLNLLLSSNSNLNICEGDTVDLYLDDQADQYRFLNNGTVVKPFSTDTFYLTSNLQDGDSITAEYTLNGCNFVADPVFVFNVNPAPDLQLGSTDNDNIICDGTPVTFDASGADNYQFYVDGNPLGFFGPDSLITTDTLTDGQTITVEGRTDSSGCLAFSDSSLTFTVNPNPNVSLQSSVNPQIICAEENVVFTANGANTYEYYVNNTIVYGPTPDATYETDSLQNGAIVYAVGYTNDCPDTSGSFTFVVNPNPVITLSNNATNNQICAGSSVTFTAATANAYQFFVDGNPVTGLSNNNIYTTSNLTDGQIVTVVGESNSCQTTSEGDTMQVDPQPAVNFSMNSDTIVCLNEEVIFSASGATQYEFLVNSNVIAGPSTIDTFAFTGLQNGDRVSVKGISAAGCSAAGDTAFRFTVLPIPNVNLYSTSLDSIITNCETVEFTALGGDTFQFFIDGVAVAPPSTNNTYITDSLEDGQTVSVIGKNTNCPAPANQEFPMTVNPLPPVTLVSSVANDTLCEGESVNLSINGTAAEFEFFINGAGQGITNNRNTTLNNLQDGDSLFGAGYSNGCPSYTDTIVFTVIDLPEVILTNSAAPSNTICAGEEVIVRASGAQKYQFFVSGISQGAPSSVDSFATRNLTNNQTITATGFTYGCAAASDSIFTYSVTSVPNINFYSSSIDNIICLGAPIEFTAQGSPEYEFFIDGVSQGPSSPVNTFNPNFTTADTFLVTAIATNNNCSSPASDSFNVVVKPLPEVLVQSSDNDNTICDGDTVEFTASGADQYRFIIDNIAQGPFSTDSVFVTDNLQDGETLTVRGLLDGCTALSDTSFNFTVNPIPNVTLFSSATANTICEGDTLRFTATGAQQYEFFYNGNSVQGPSAINIFEADTFSSGNYVSVTGSSLGCAVSDELTDSTKVNPLPTVRLSVSDTLICSGENITLTATGASLYEFFADGVSLGSPTTSSSFQTNVIQDGEVITVKGTLANSCSAISADSFEISVNSYPNVTLQVNSNTTICNGTPVDFTASGADNYTFLVNGNSVLGPGPTATYNTDTLRNNQSVSLLGETDGCTILADSIYDFTVYNYPVVTFQSNIAKDSICNNDKVIFTASGAALYQYAVNGIAQGVPTPVDTFAISSLQSGDEVSVEGINNICRAAATDTFSYTVINYPQATMTSSIGGNTICFGDTIDFTAANAEQYRFYINELPLSSLSPDNTFSSANLEDGDWVRVEAANYTCARFSADSIQVSVNKMNLQLTSNLSANIACEGESVTFTASGADEYEFFVDGISQGAASGNNSITLNNLQEGQIVNVEGSNFNTGCTMLSEFPFQIAILPEPEITVDGNTQFCQGDTVTLESNSPVNNQWFLDGNLMYEVDRSSIPAYESGDYVLSTYQGGNGNFATVGGNAQGQLGNGNTIDSRLLYTSTTTDSLIDLDAGLAYNLAVRADGTVYSWGDNGWGQLGNSNFANQNRADDVAVLFPSQAVAAGEEHGLALRNGQVFSWGRNTEGQLGNGTTTTSNFPLPVDTFTNIVAIAAGESHSMYLRNDGTVWSWGGNTFGQLGTGNFNDALIPVQVQGLPATITAIAAGSNHSLALDSDSVLWVWGNNAEGQLGVNSINFSNLPIQNGMDRVIAIDGGKVHSLALRDDGQIYSWGANQFGQLGIGLTGGNYFRPVRIRSLKGLRKIEAGPYSNFAFKADQSVWGWGLNDHSQLGDSTVQNRNAPVFLSRFSGASKIAAGENHTALIYGFSKACASDPVTLQVDSNPQPQIFNTWPTLSASEGVAYQWYVDGIAIPNATNQVLDDAVDGEYTVEVTYANGCSAISEGYAYATGISISELESMIQVLPNPNNGQFNIVLKDPNLGNLQRIDLISSTGQWIESIAISRNTGNIIPINKNAIGSGLYFVKLTWEDKVLLKKVIVNR